jgi:uncharacterized membrane protein YidH (DUF202 family)
LQQSSYYTIATTASFNIPLPSIVSKLTKNRCIDLVTMSSRGHKKTDSQASYYFVSQLAGTNAVRDRGDDGDVIENMPPGVEAGAFSPRRVNKPPTRHPSYQREAPPAVTSQRTATSEGHSHGIFEFLSGKKHQNLGNQKVTDSGTKKVDPKVYFSTERTFLAWMHAAVLLAGISIAITAYSDTGSASAIYGLMLLPIAIVAIVYSMLQCKLIAGQSASIFPKPVAVLSLFSLQSIGSFKKDHHD